MKQQSKKYSEIKATWWYRLYKIGFLLISFIALIIATINNNKWHFDWGEWFAESIMWIIIISFAYFIIWRSLLYVVYGKIEFKASKQRNKQKQEDKKEIPENYNLIKNIGAWGVFLIPFIYEIDKLRQLKNEDSFSSALGISLAYPIIYLLLLKALKPKKTVNVIAIFLLLFFAFLLGNNIDLLS